MLKEFITNSKKNKEFYQTVKCLYTISLVDNNINIVKWM